MLKKLLTDKREVLDLSFRKATKKSLAFSGKNKNRLKFLGTLFLFVFMGFSVNAQCISWMGNEYTTLGTNYLGDQKLFEIQSYQPGPNQGAQVYIDWGNNGYGSTQNVDWYNLPYVSPSGNNSKWNAFVTMKEVGTHNRKYLGYNGCSGDYITSDQGVFSVSALSNPTSPIGTSISDSQIDLSWVQWNSKNVLVVRSLSSAAASTTPTQATTYAVGNSLGTGTVVYNGSATSFSDTGLTAGLSYTYVFYSVNNDYYSSGVSIVGKPFSCTWDGSAWSNSTGPDADIEAIIAGNYSTTTNGTFIAKKLTVNSGKSLTVDSGTNITVTGTTTNAGIINNEGTITNTGLIKNISTASGTGYLLSSTSIANVTQEHYLTSNQRGWRLLSNPLSAVTFGALASGSTTPFTLGANASGAYDSVTNTWSNGVDTDNMVSQQAYKVFVRGITSEVTALTYSVHPPSHVTVSVTGNAANAVPAAITTLVGQYYLVANPYTAPVSVASILGASSGLSSTVSYYNPTKASAGGTDLEIKKGGYDAVVVSGVAGSATDVVLPPMGAIFVYATTAGTINVPKSAIYTGAISGGNYNHKTTSTKTVVPTALTINVGSNGVDYDKLQLQFKAEGTAGSNIDFGKLPNTILDFYSINAGENRAVSELELKEQTIPLGITSSALQNFTFNIAENSIPAGFEAILEDKLLNSKTVLTTGTNYNFNIDATATSQGTARFAITLKTTSSLAVKDQTLDSKIMMWPNPAHNQFYIWNNQQEGDTTFKIYSTTGQLIHGEKSVPGSTTTINTNGWAAGVYILDATNNGNKTTKQLIIQ